MGFPNLSGDDLAFANIPGKYGYNLDLAVS
jgi:hypothetical protein